MHIKRLILCLSGIFILSCNQSQVKNEDQSCEKPQMYKSSELAQLMRDMYTDCDTIRQSILHGTWPDSLPSYFDKIHTAKATTPSDINETYHSLAKEYLNRYEALKKAKPELRKDAHNYLIKGCISCHQVYCNGPIAKINKLLLP